MTVFCCPHCGGALTTAGGSARCAAGHSFDFAGSGYLNLLPPTRRHSEDPGDNRQMVAAWARFLAGGSYDVLADAVVKQLADLVPAGGAVLDAGCGEGYFTAAVRAGLPGAGWVGGVDISKSAVDRAARRHKGCRFAVAGVHALPVADGSLAAVTNLFAPHDEREFWRVLQPGGHLLVAAPGPRHLWGLKRVLYEVPYQNPPFAYRPAGLSLCRQTAVTTQLQLSDPQQIADLFAMTPYCYRTPPQKAEELLGRQQLDTPIEFVLALYQKLPPEAENGSCL